MSFYKQMLSFLLDTYLRVKLLSHKVCECLSLQENTNLFSKMVHPHTSQVWEFQFPHVFSNTKAVNLLLVLLIILICISLISNDNAWF